MTRKEQIKSAYKQLGGSANFYDGRLADPELIICDYLKDNPSINNSEGRVLTGISDTIKMKDVFVRLRERGIIEIVPRLKGNATRWRLKSGAPSITDSDESTLSKSDQYTLEEFM